MLRWRHLLTIVTERSRILLMKYAGAFFRGTGGLCRCHCLTDTDRAFSFDNFTFQFQHITRYYFSLEFCGINCTKISCLSFVLIHAEDGYRTNLCQCFYHKHTWHNRFSRKMSAEKLFIICNCLISDSTFSRNKLFYLIYQQKRMSVRR